MTAERAFRYRAARFDGAEEVGVVHAVNRDTVSTELVRRGLFPIEIRAGAPRRRRDRKMKVQDVALGLRTLASLLESGLPMSRALTAMEDLAPASWREPLADLQSAVHAGTGLGSALESLPVGLPESVIGIIRAGEAGGGLAASVRRAAELMDGSAALRSAIRNALAYPILLAAAGTASIVLLVGVVLPRFGAILEGLGQPLPATTRVVLAGANALRAGVWPALLMILIGSLAWRAWVSSDPGRERWHAALLALPVIGGVRLSATTARVCAALGSLIESGVPVVHALAYVSRAGGDAAVARRLMAAREAVKAGQSVSRALERERAMTATAVRLIGTAERTGRLATMLRHAARIERERTEQSTRTTVRMLEPALILVFAAIVSLIAAALLQAIYTVRPVP